MYRMAIGAVRNLFQMDVCTCLLPGKGIIMALTADNCLAAAEQVFGVTGMGAVAVDTTVAVLVGKVIMHLQAGITDILMAADTDILMNSIPAAIVAVGAAICKGRVQNIPDYPFPVAAVRIVAGQTALDSDRKITVQPIHLSGTMTALAYFLGISPQQLIIIRGVRKVAGITLSLPIWLVRKLKLNRQTLMAVQAALGEFVLEQALFFRRMGIMAGET